MSESRVRGNSVVLDSGDEAVDHFVGELARLRTAGNRVIVAVGGPTAVGKSTLAHRFQEAATSSVPARILEGDRFLIPQARRRHPARFPDDVYEIDRLQETVRALAAGRTVRVPFYERDGRHTGRLTLPSGQGAALPVTEEIAESCVRRCTDPDNAIVTDPETGDLLEVVEPWSGLWIFDSELSLYFEDLLPLYAASYGIRASRSRRKRHFLSAVTSGQRYPYLTPAEAEAKIEGFWDTDDALIEPTVARADVQIALP